jgi:hypothetical protein
MHLLLHLQLTIRTQPTAAAAARHSWRHCHPCSGNPKGFSSDLQHGWCVHHCCSCSWREACMLTGSTPPSPPPPPLPSPRPSPAPPAAVQSSLDPSLTSPWKPLPGPASIVAPADCLASKPKHLQLFTPFKRTNNSYSG